MQMNGYTENCKMAKKCYKGSKYGALLILCSTESMQTNGLMENCKMAKKWYKG